MNKLETYVYKIVRSNPAVKQFVRNIYQSFFDIFVRKKEFFKYNYEYKEGYFFGFHDISPFSQDETKVLAHKYSRDFKMPNKQDVVDIGYFDFNKGKLGDWHCVGKSYAWNWHKGARLQWVDNKNIIFNTAINDSLVSKVVNIDSLEERIICSPIDSIYVSGEQMVATTFSYERLQRCMPGYGYPYSDDSFLDKNYSMDTGLYEIDINTGVPSLLLSLSEIATVANTLEENEYLHFVTHSEYSKDGKYISFLYRRIPKKGNYMKRRTNIMVYDRELKRLQMLPTHNSGSHYVWNNKHEIIASCFMNGKNCHVLYNIDECNNYSIIAEERLNFDGHQSWINNNLFVTDCYPDKYRLASIFRVNTQEETVETILSIYSPKKFQTKNFECHIACDLHPRVSPSGCFMCFDSPRTGVRSLYIMNLCDINNE